MANEITYNLDEDCTCLLRAKANMVIRLPGILEIEIRLKSIEIKL